MIFLFLFVCLLVLVDSHHLQLCVGIDNVNAAAVGIDPVHLALSGCVKAGYGLKGCNHLADWVRCFVFIAWLHCVFSGGLTRGVLAVGLFTFRLEFLQENSWSIAVHGNFCKKILFNSCSQQYRPLGTRSSYSHMQCKIRLHSSTSPVVLLVTGHTWRNGCPVGILAEHVQRLKHHCSFCMGGNLPAESECREGAMFVRQCASRGE